MHAIRRYTAFHALCALVLVLAGCGSGDGTTNNNNGGGTLPPSNPQNVQAITVNAGPVGIPNIPFISITLCAPGSSTNCQTINNIQIDTGSTGLRILSSVLSPALSLPQARDSTGNPIVECIQFADGYSWGPVKAADLHIAGEQASSLPIQVIGDPSFTSVPTSCSSSGPPENTVQDFGANGLLGVGLFLQDCGAACAQLLVPGFYYICPASGCESTQVAVAQQVQNPVSQFNADNNGVLISLPTLPAAGAATASGSLTFGIGTQSNNALGSAAVLAVNSSTGNIITTYNNTTYTDSYIDSGSSVMFFGSSAFAACTAAGKGFYCPASTQNLTATLQGTNQKSSTISFAVANADQLFGVNPTFMAFNDLAAPNGDPSSFAWGLPFFYGRNVYTAFEGKTTTAGQGPFFAF